MGSRFDRSKPGKLCKILIAVDAEFETLPEDTVER
ncbi:hypothetical protein ES705_20567 [subsurface metagenome]